jgi:6-phospho-beta-glucosidase
VTRDVIDFLAAATREGDANADMAQHKLSQLLGAIPIGYVHYFLFRAKKIKEAKSAPQTRAQVIMDIEKGVFEEVADPAVHARPQGLNKRGGGGYSGVTFGFMKAIYFNKGEELVCSTINRGCVDGIPDDASVEIVCRIDRNGALPLRVGEIPLAFRGLVQAVKAYETLTVKAALTGEKKYIQQALVNHPLVGDLDVIEPLVDDLCAAHGLNFK